MIKKDVKTKLKEYFLVNPTIKLRLRHIEKETNLSFPLISKYSKELVQENILKTIEISGVIFYSANRSSNTFLLDKKLFNIKQLYDSNLIQHLINEFSNPAIIIFGSYSKGEDIEDSDIDIFIETISEKKVNLHKFEKKLQRNIQIFQNKSINNIKNINLANNIINGFNLNKQIEVFKDG